MSDELMSAEENKIHVGGPADPQDHAAGAAGIYPGMAVTMYGKTDGSVIPMDGNNAEHAVYGVAGLREGGNIDQVYAVGEPVPIHKKKSATVVRMNLAAKVGPIAVYAGDIAAASATDAGMVDKSNAAVARLEVGVIQNYNAGSATLNKVIDVKL